MNLSYVTLIAKNSRKIVSNPLLALKLLWRRVFPFGIVPKDPEAYRIGSWSYGDIARLPARLAFPEIEKTPIQIFNPFMKDPTTSIDPYETLFLCGLAKARACTRVLEIGTFDGNTALNLAANLGDQAQVYTVDLPRDWQGGFKIKVPAVYENNTDRQLVASQYEHYPEFARKITQVFCDSRDLRWEELGGPFDLIFIDANHHEDYVRHDTEGALKNLKKGGLIVWHDYGMIDDVSRVVDSYQKRLPIRIIQGTRMAVGVAP